MIDPMTDNEQTEWLDRLDALVVSGRHPDQAAALDRLDEDLQQAENPQKRPEDPERWDGMS